MNQQEFNVIINDVAKISSFEYPITIKDNMENMLKLYVDDNKIYDYAIILCNGSGIDVTVRITQESDWLYYTVRNPAQSIEAIALNA